MPRKPDPTAVLQIAGEMGATPEETIYIGDSEVDIRTGHAAGMRHDRRFLGISKQRGLKGSERSVYRGYGTGASGTDIRMGREKREVTEHE